MNFIVNAIYAEKNLFRNDQTKNIVVKHAPKERRNMLDNTKNLKYLIVLFAEKSSKVYEMMQKRVVESVVLIGVESTEAKGMIV